MSLPSKSQYYKLYVVHDAHNSIIALRNIKALLDEKLGQAYRIETIDVFESPEMSEKDRVAAVPTLIRVHPKPIKRLVGDLSNTDQVCLVLGFSGGGAP